MSGADLKPTVLLATFYQRLGSVEPIIRIVLYEAQLSALLTFRGDPEKKAFLDFKKEPALIQIDGEATEGEVRVTIDGGVMHRILLGVMHPGEALARREMLLRGSASDLAKFIRLLEFGPLLYDEHMADVGYDGYSRRKGEPPLREAIMKDKVFNGDPIPTVKLSGFEKFVSGTVNKLGYIVGYMLGVMRYRLVEKLSLFDVLTSMSRGLEAARPERKAVED
ncbi:hypothetical protein ACFLQK_00245 [bacterium]